MHRPIRFTPVLLVILEHYFASSVIIGLNTLKVKCTYNALNLFSFRDFFIYKYSRDYGWPRLPRPNVKSRKKMNLFSYIFLLVGSNMSAHEWASPKWVKSNERKKRERRETKVSVTMVGNSWGTWEPGSN